MRLFAKKEPFGEKGTLLDFVRDGASWILKGEQSIPYETKDDLSVLGRDRYKVLVLDDKTARVIRFADLHRHSDNSLLDGMTKISEMVDATEYCGGLTDHGVMYGFLEFYKGMKKAGKKPVIGFEAYVEDMKGELNRNHLCLFAKNEAGFKNLIMLCSEASEHFNRKPHVTWEMLEKYHDGVIATSACLAGVIQQGFLTGDSQLAEAALDRYLSIFGEDFYLEIQRHHLDDEAKVNPELLRLAKEREVPIVAATDSHYLRKGDKESHEVLLCLQTKKTLSEPHWSFPGNGYHIHTSEEMEDLFGDIPEVLDETLNLADKVSLNIKLGEVSMPKFDIPAPYKNDNEYFDFLCNKGFAERFAGSEKEKDPVYLERFSYELEMIKNMGFPGYFLIVWDYINWAREHGIYVGPGRGSAAGSLVAYCLGITDLDPIQYNLLFERFLNPERVSMPDIDVDFEHSRRGEVIQYVKERYGDDHVSHIVTFGTMAARMAVKDVARVMDLPASEGAQIAKLIPAEVKMTIDKAMGENPDLKAAYESSGNTQKVVDVAKAVEGCKRHSSQHACGVLIAAGPIHNWLPTSMEVDKETGEKGLTAQVSMTECEDLGLLKMDFLGLKNMTVIHEVVDGVVRDFGLDAILKKIGHPEAKSFRYQDIPMTDRETYKMLAKGLTGGVFQLESPGMTRVITEMFDDIDKLPDSELHQCFERLIAAVALYRPGPLDYIPDYQAGRGDPSKIVYDCPEEESILLPTYGVMVFQEQLMQIAQKLAGFSLAEADILRKACGKKKLALMNEEHSKFVYGNKADFDAGRAKAFFPGCVGNGISENVAEAIWDKMVKFASYAFNRSHAACYAFIAYITAYMSCHWPEYFYSAMLNAFIANNDKVKVYLSQAASRKIAILPPDINRSGDYFTVDNAAGGVRFGLKGIAGMNKLATEILAERENGEYKDFEDFYNRLCSRDSKPGKDQLEKLIFAGAFDSFGFNKKQLMHLASTVVADYEATKKKLVAGQVSLFEGESFNFSVPAMDDFAQDDLLEREFDALGIYLSGHPAQLVYEKTVNTSLHPVTIASLVESESDVVENAFIIGQIRDLQKRYTKKGDAMYSFVIQDQFYSVRGVVFPKDAVAIEQFLVDGNVLGFSGRFVKDDNFGDQIIVSLVHSKENMLSRKMTRLVVIVNNKAEQEALFRLLSNSELPVSDGGIPVWLKTPKSDKLYFSHKSVNASLSFLDLLSCRWKFSFVEK